MHELSPKYKFNGRTNLMRKLFYPQYRFHSVYQISPDFLKDKGIKLIILDIDNTLVMHGGPVDEKAESFIKMMTGSGLYVALLSNNSKKRLSLFNQDLGLFSIHRGNKPFVFGYKKIMKNFHVNSKETITIGDQIFTDIMGGNIAGIQTILVDPVRVDETKFIRFKRKLENLVYKR